MGQARRRPAQQVLKPLMDRTRFKAAFRAAVGLLMWAGLFLLTDSLCLFQALFGIPCPGCGSTRAAIELFHGHFSEAFAYHPLIPLSLAILPYAVFRGAFRWRRPVHNAEKIVVMCILSTYIIVYIIRMVLLFPHTQPMVPLDKALWPSVFRWIRSLIQ
jgi:hypothetical protein